MNSVAEYNYTASGVIPINTVLLGPVELRKAQGFRLHVPSVGAAGAITIRGSLDGITWFDLQNRSVAAGTQQTTVGITGLFIGACPCNFLQVVLTTATTAGTTTVRLSLAPESDLEGSTTNQNVAIAAGSALIGKVVNDLSATAANGPAFTVAALAAALATTNAALVKASAGRVAKLTGYNAASTPRYLRLFNKATAPTVGTDTPFFTLPLAPLQAFQFDVSAWGLSFSTGIGYAITAAAPALDATACAAGDVTALSIIYI